MLSSNRKWLQFHSNQEQSPRLYPGSPASPEQVSHSHLSPQPLSAVNVYLHYWRLYFLQHPCIKPCPSKTWPRLKHHGRTSPSTAVCLWPLPSWCSPQAFRGLMASKLASKRTTDTNLHACCGWSLFKTQKLCVVRRQQRRRKTSDWQWDGLAHYGTEDPHQR